MAKTKTYPWNAATHLKTKEDIAAYLEAVLEDGDSNLITAALGDIACAKGMTQIARETGLGRASLYKGNYIQCDPWQKNLGLPRTYKYHGNHRHIFTLMSWLFFALIYRNILYQSKIRANYPSNIFT